MLKTNSFILSSLIVFSNNFSCVESKVHSIEDLDKKGADKRLLKTKPYNYSSRIRKIIINNWNPERTPSDKFKVGICFDIEKNGTVNNAIVCEKTDDKEFNLIAKQAVLDSSPLPELPEELSQKGLFSIEIDLTHKTLYSKKHSTGTSLINRESYEYMSEIQKKIKSTWGTKIANHEFKRLFADSEQKHLQAAACFDIDRGGNLQKLELCKTSPIKKFNRFCKQAIYDASPFLPPPQSVIENHDAISIDFLFEYLISKKHGYNGAKI